MFEIITRSSGWYSHTLEKNLLHKTHIRTFTVMHRLKTKKIIYKLKIATASWKRKHNFANGFYFNVDAF